MGVWEMAQQGASLQNYNNELVKCLEDLREKREQINREIAREEDDKNKIQNDLKILTERLSRINDSLARKVAARNEYDQTIQEGGSIPEDSRIIADATPRPQARECKHE